MKSFGVENRAIAGRWRKISHHVIVGKGVKARIPEPGLASIISATRKCSDPTSLLLEIRRNPYIPSDVYPALGEIQTLQGIKRIPALIHISKVRKVPFESFLGLFKESKISFKCLGNSYEANAGKLILLSPTLRSIPEKILSNLIELVNWLTRNQDRISKECGGQSFSLAYLIQALSAKGRIPHVQKFKRLASARDLYDRSPTLQRIPEGILNNPIEVISWLHKNREAIRNEASEGKSLALSTLVNALLVTRKISDEQSFMRLAGSRDLYDRSPTLQRVPKGILNNPIEVISWLHKNREAIRNEASESESLALSTLANSLQAARRISDEQRFIRLAGGKDLYDRSITLQSIPQEILNYPVELVDWLHKNREAIRNEASEGKSLALSTLIDALQATRKISDEQTFHRLATGRDLYDRSPTLQGIPERTLNNPIEIISWLHKNREAIRNEASESESLALATLNNALQAAKKIPFDQTFHRLAGSRDLYDRSPTLQGIPEGILNNPIEIISWLHKNREAIRNEASESESLALGTLVEALQAAKRISCIQKFNRLASARDLYDRSPTLQGIPEGILNNPIEVISWLHKHREAIRNEASESESLALGTLADSLQAARRISDKQSFMRLAGSRDLYDRSPTLQGIPEGILNNPIEVISWLHKHREAIRNEASEKESLALGTLADGLQAARRIPYDQNFNRLAGARDFYDRTFVLHGGKQNWDTIEEIIRFIDKHRKALLRKDKKGRVSNTYVVNSLNVARRIDPKVNMRILIFQAAAANYARRFETKVRVKIRSAVKAYLKNYKGNIRKFDPFRNHHWVSLIDRSDFKSIKGNKPLSAKYIKTILKWARKLYGNEVALKTAKRYFTSHGK